MKVANEQVDVDIGIEDVREGIAVGLNVIVIEKLDVVIVWIHVGRCLFV